MPLSALDDLAALVSAPDTTRECVVSRAQTDEAQADIDAAISDCYWLACRRKMEAYLGPERLAEVPRTLVDNLATGETDVEDQDKRVFLALTAVDTEEKARGECVLAVCVRRYHDLKPGDLTKLTPVTFYYTGPGMMGFFRQATAADVNAWSEKQGVRPAPPRSYALFRFAVAMGGAAWQRN